MFIGTILWLLFAILVGVYGRRHGSSFFIYFLLSVLLSPLIGLLIALVATPGRNNKQ